MSSGSGPEISVLVCSIDRGRAKLCIGNLILSIPKIGVFEANTFLRIKDHARIKDYGLRIKQKKGSNLLLTLFEQFSLSWHPPSKQLRS